MAFRNDGEAITGIERATKAQAMNDCKEAFRSDYEQCGHDPGNDYYIEQYEDLEGIAAIIDLHLLKMTIGKNGGVRCERKDFQQ